MLFTVFSLASALAWSPVSPLTPGACRAAPRCQPLRAAEEPFRSDELFDYFRRKKEVSVSLEKPLGAVLKEAGAAGGVCVEELLEEGSASTTGALKKSDRLLRVADADVSSSSLDDVMAILVDASSPVEIDLERNVIVKVVRKAPVLTYDGQTLEMQKGSIMRTAVVKNGLELYSGMAKLTNCGGTGSCSTCWVDVKEGAENLSPRTAVEEKKGAKRPPTYRMACQVLVNGDVTVETPPKK